MKRGAVIDVRPVNQQEWVIISLEFEDTVRRPDSIQGPLGLIRFAGSDMKLQPSMLPALLGRNTEFRKPAGRTERQPGTHCVRVADIEGGEEQIWRQSWGNGQLFEA